MTDTFTLTGTVHDRHDRPMQDAQLVIKARSGVLADPNADRIYGQPDATHHQRLGTLCDRGCSPHPPTSRGAGGMASNANPAVKSVTADLRITLVTLASQRNHFRQTMVGPTPVRARSPATARPRAPSASAPSTCPRRRISSSPRACRSLVRACGYSLLTWCAAR